MLTTHWEEAAAFAGMALDTLTAHEQDCRKGLARLGLQFKHVQWTLHTVVGR